MMWCASFVAVAVGIVLLCLRRLFQTCKQTHWQVRWSISMLATTAIGIPYTYSILPQQLPWAMLGLMLSIFWVQYATLRNWGDGVPKEYMRQS